MLLRSSRASQQSLSLNHTGSETHSRQVNPPELGFICSHPAVPPPTPADPHPALPPPLPSLLKRFPASPSSSPPSR
ncbi:hypothetical protein CesoFtcFv8_012226 [Champsocephalus esox]|uniref:Uncharacterized protein n=1 Tax=Champsocephalus esox TaxID=159716 RepID=A0AAN8BTW0_9TELE|nr:hypothetical protein CesoFtcFv8_012226 [Champsocephalus esox]